MASTTLLLLAYCVAIAACSYLGGRLPGRVKMTHTGTQLIMSTVSGLMLGVAFYHLLPHSIALRGEPAGVDSAVWWLVVGLIVMLLLLRLFNFHEHDFSAEHSQQHEHEPHGSEPHVHATEVAGNVHGLSWVGLSIGLGLHTLIDGIALGAVMSGGVAADGLLGVGVFLAILLHKPLDSMSIVTVMQALGWDRAARERANILFALLCPLGALLFYFGLGMAAESVPIVAAALAFSAGAFICIALSDLLPEVHFHSHDKVKLTLAFLLGIGIAYGMGMLEPPSFHNH
ncbi:MAG: ZIP family metal transporter [Halioglobus sp.]